MSTRLLVSFEDLKRALNVLKFHELDGEVYLDARALLDVVTDLTGLREGPTVPDLFAQPSPARKTDVSSFADIGHAPESPAGWDPAPAPPAAVGTLEEERARLAALPLGNCVCGHLEHFDGRCVECDCADYVDTTVRDPHEVARDLMSRGGDPPPWWRAQPQEAIAPAVSMAEAGGPNEHRALISDRPPVQ